ncbi:hypothetical protein GE061_010771 [Apolygus lucorum]|uniref:Proctolin n=1 Tax=Apolygus lucorum TaxID=248454 RepID=A0A6A4JLV7_APOLU|nr:hypothetical protein GE061_010771 [Apolygus lucorum]
MTSPWSFQYIPPPGCLRSPDSFRQQYLPVRSPEPYSFKQTKMYRKLFAGLMVVCLLAMFAEARYLPTRSQDDRLVRLRQLLKDLLDNDFDDLRPEHQMAGYDPRMFKRDAYDRVPYMQH